MIIKYRGSSSLIFSLWEVNAFEHCYVSHAITSVPAPGGPMNE